MLFRDVLEQVPGNAHQIRIPVGLLSAAAILAALSYNP